MKLVDPATGRSIADVADATPEDALAALAKAVAALSRLALLSGKPVAEAEINPLMVLPRGQGVVAVDALVKLSV